jgi:type I restriction enzyme S subunit
MIADVQGGLTKGQKRESETSLREVPYLRVANVQRGYLDLTIVKTIAATDEEIRQLKLEPGDVLFNEGGDRDKLGRGWVWSGELPECIHQNHVFRARILTSDVLPRYLSCYGNGSGQTYFFDHGKQTTNLASINLSKLKRLPVPLAPVTEQRRIMSEFDRILSITDNCDHQVAQQLDRIQRLRQSVLKWAFEGKLSDQHADDEPAATLLERIRSNAEMPRSSNARSRQRQKHTAA